MQMKNMKNGGRIMDSSAYQLIRYTSGMICVLVLLLLFVGEAFGALVFPDRTVYVIVALIGALLGLDQILIDSIFGGREPPGGKPPGGGGDGGGGGGGSP